MPSTRGLYTVISLDEAHMERSSPRGICLRVMVLALLVFGLYALLHAQFWRVWTTQEICSPPLLSIIIPDRTLCRIIHCSTPKRAITQMLH